MATAYSLFPSTNLIRFSTIHQITKNNVYSSPSVPSRPIQFFVKNQNFQLPQVASISYPLTDLDYLETEFGDHGVTFTGISDSCVVKMALEDGTAANLMLPSGLITSFKVPMWHGGTTELLHTSVSEGEDGQAVIQGGLSLALECENEPGLSWSPDSWSLHQVKGSPQKSIQVELVSRNQEGSVELRHIISLDKDLLTSEVVVSNTSTSSLYMTGSVMSHLTVSTPEATYALGLAGSDFFTRPPVSAEFGIIPPGFGNKESRRFSALDKVFGKWGSRNQSDSEEEGDGEEKDNYKHLTREMSRVYTSAPRSFTIMDRGKRNSVTVGRERFDELYVFSPGSEHEWYGKYSYICIGQAALLKPIVLETQGQWRGAQHLHNPNS